ncbi:MAG: serine hydrolase domain-containing protein [bacterium]
MIKNIAIGIAVLLVVFLIWFFRPFAPYSPAAIILDREYGDRIETYRTMENLYPYHEVRGAQTPIILQSVTAMPPPTYQWQGKEKTLAEFIEEANVTSFLVVKDGKVVFEEYYHGETADSHHTSWSVAKSYVATLIGIAMKEGKISSLDDTVASYAPQFKGTEYGEETLRNLLMMSSGMDFIEDYDARGSDIRKLFFDVFILNKDVDKFISKYKKNEEPGQRFNYQSPNSHVLSAVIRGVYDKPLSEIVSEKIYQPLGMENASWLVDRNKADGKELGYCCLNTRTRDYAKFGMLYLQDGYWQGEQILPEGWTSFVRTPPTQSHKPGALGSAHFGYGHHFWLPPGADGEFYASGFNGQNIWIDLNRNVVVVKTAADEQDQPRAPETVAVLRALAEAADQL